MKRSVILPLILLIYLIGISIYAWPGRNPEISFMQYGITIAVTLIVIVILFFLLKRRDKLRENMKKKR